MKANDLCLRRSYVGGWPCQNTVVERTPGLLVCPSFHRWDEDGQRHIDLYQVRSFVPGGRLAHRLIRGRLLRYPRLCRILYQALSFKWWSGPTWQAEWDEAPFAVRGVTRRGTRQRAVEARRDMAFWSGRLCRRRVGIDKEDKP